MVSAAGAASAVKVTTSKLTFDASTGQLTAVDFNSTSDQNLKKNIIQVSDPLEKISMLTGVEFDWIDNSGSSVGVLAQQVEKIYPQLVVTDPNGDKAVRYNGLVGLLVEAVKELLKRIEK
jgi:hypothetical protein